MTTVVLVADRSSLFTTGGAFPNVGYGQDQHLPIGATGVPATILWRAAIGFPVPAWPLGGTITSATLRAYRADGTHVALTAGKTVVALRAAAAWVANGAERDGVTTGDPTEATVYPGPAYAGSGPAVAAGATFDWDVTTAVRAMAPASMGGSGAAWLGFLLMASDPSAASSTELWSARYVDTPYRPTLTIVYTAARVPDAPVLTAPVGSLTDASTMRLTHSHPDALAPNAYDLELRDGLAIIWTLAAATATIAGNLISTAYAGPALVVGHPYTWRARTRDTLGQWGSWSAWAAFTPSGVVGVPPSAYDRWASIVLAALAEPAIITRLGTITPIGPDEILPIVCAEFGDRWQVVHDHSVPPIDRTVRVLGMSVSLTPDGVTVDAITEEVEA